jgi:hypothetical protein
MPHLARRATEQVHAERRTHRTLAEVLGSLACSSGSGSIRTRRVGK